jgi:hypothetical protein
VHLNSPLDLLFSPFVRYEPSLARLGFVFDALRACSEDRKSSATAESSSTASPMRVPLLLKGSLNGHLSPLELVSLRVSSPRAPVFFRFRFRRFEAPCPSSCRAATIAAALFAPVAFMLFLLVTLWEGLTAPKDIEWECCLVVEWRVGMLEGGVEFIESRWELCGLVACVSCSCDS